MGRATLRSNGASERPRAVLSVAEPEAGAFFPEPTLEALGSLCRIRRVEPAELQDTRAYAEAMGDAEIAITSWSFPRLDAEHVRLAPRLRFVMHTGASIRWLVDEDFWDAGIPISQAGDAMAPAVAELSLTFTLGLLRRLPRLDHALRDDQDWAQARSAPRGREIRGARVGVIAASRTGRRYIEACCALGAHVRVYDPYLPAGDALQAAATSLDELLSGSDVVAVHAPLTPETAGMIGARELALMRDGAVLVNTARAAVLDMDALYAEVSSGRLDAGLDVFDVEPLPVPNRWRRLPNVLLTPHLGGATVESRRRAGQLVVEEVSRFLAGLPLRYPVRRERAGILG